MTLEYGMPVKSYKMTRGDACCDTILCDVEFLEDWGPYKKGERVKELNIHSEYVNCDKHYTCTKLVPRDEECS